MKKRKAGLPSEGSQGKELRVTPGVAANEYFLDIASRVRTAKYIILIVLILFILCMISVFRTDITIENCKYLIRFFSSTTTTYSGDYDSIYYDTQGVTDMKMFNSDLICVKSDGLEFYNMTGNSTASYSLSYVNPTIVTGGKYMLVYDLGGTGYSLFNNFTKMFEDNFEYPISTAAVSRDGMYAIVTKSLDYQSVINIYDRDFNPVSKIYKEKYISDIKINSSGTELIISSIYAENGEYKSEIMRCTPYSNEALDEISLNGEYAVISGYHANAGFSILSDTALHTYSSDGEEISGYALGGIIPTKCMILDNYSVLIYNENIVGTKSNVLIFNDKGEQLYSLPIDSQIVSADSSLDNLFMLTDRRIIRINMKTGAEKSAEISQSALSLFVIDNDNIIVTYPTEAKAYKVLDLFED